MKKLVVLLAGLSLSLPSLAEFIDCTSFTKNIVAEHLPGVWIFDRELTDTFGIDHFGEDGDVLTFEVSSNVNVEEFSFDNDDTVCVHQKGYIHLSSEEGELIRQPFVLAGYHDNLYILVNTEGPFESIPVYMLLGASKEMDLLSVRENYEGVAPAVFRRKNS